MSDYRATVLIIRDGRVLLVKDKGRGDWSLPGGGFKAKESTLQAGIREVREELSLLVTSATRLAYCDFQGQRANHKVCLVTAEGNPRIDWKELDDYIWWDRKQAIPVQGHVRRILSQYLTRNPASMSDRADAAIESGAVLELANSFANEAMHTVALQRRRLRSQEPEDAVFVFRWWADLQFFVIALRRLRRAAELASTVPAYRADMEAHIQSFDNAISALKIMRDVGEHFSDYVLGSKKRYHSGVKRDGLHVGQWDGTTFNWLNHKLNIDEAAIAAERLNASIRAAAKPPVLD